MAKKSAKRKAIKRVVKKVKKPLKKTTAVSRKPLNKSKKSVKATKPLKIKKQTKAKQTKKPAPKNLVGKVSHYFTNIGVGVIELTKPLKVGDKISIQGTTTKFEQKIDSIQIEREPVSQAKKGDAIGLKVKKRVREHDKVYIVK